MRTQPCATARPPCAARLARGPFKSFGCGLCAWAATAPRCTAAHSGVSWPLSPSKAEASLTDVHTPEQRRRNMRAVRNRDTRQELQLRRALRAARLIGYRVNSAGVLGRPDVTFTRWRVAVFVDGCFWHGCPLCYRPPASNVEFWSQKLAQNRSRDQEVTSNLVASGWTVLRFWEHEISDDLDGCLTQIRQALEAAGRQV